MQEQDKSTLTHPNFSQGIISADEVAVSFEPTTEEVANNGELTFGGTDSKHIIVVMAPLI